VKHGNRNHFGGIEMDLTQKTVTSRDGTTIAYEQSGQGPVTVLISSALADRSDTRKLAQRLSESFTVINYDRRGRGLSTDAPDYSPEREVEDLVAMVDALGEPVRLFGNSSGAVLALDAANALKDRVLRLALYEPPLIIDNSRPPVPDGLPDQITGLAATGRGSEAVKLFFRSAMGIPPLVVAFMRFMPGWSKSVAMAGTAAYDLTILQGLQSGKPLPAERWASLTAPTLVITGEKSEAFFHSGAKALAGALAHAEHRVLPRQHHGSVAMASSPIVDTLLNFWR
jgi:pimeloyl-ACP methyl ester carboxylesterase